MRRPGAPGAPDTIVSLVLLAVSGYVLYDTASYPDPVVPGTPGPALFPRLIATLIAVSAGVLLIRSVRASEQDRRRVDRKGPARLALSVVFIVLFLLTVPHWDTYVLLPLLMSSIMLVMGERGYKTILTTALVFDLFVYLVFYRFFGVPLPTVYF